MFHLSLPTPPSAPKKTRFPNNPWQNSSFESPHKRRRILQKWNLSKGRGKGLKWSWERRRAYRECRCAFQSPWFWQMAHTGYYRRSKPATLCHLAHGMSPKAFIYRCLACTELNFFCRFGLDQKVKSLTVFPPFIVSSHNVSNIVKGWAFWYCSPFFRFLAIL